MRLSKMFKDAPTVNIHGLTFDSRKVEKGDMYFCLPGLNHDGHEFITDAVNNGAIAVVHSKPLSPDMPPAIYLRVDDVNAAMNQAARIFYSRPSDKLEMFGITGTNGKSTIANIIRYFENLERPCGYIGTIEIAYGNTRLAPNLTTPDALFLQKTLKDMVDARMKACALEVSSHGLALHRVDGINFDAAIFTNFTYDHLDFHGTMENYFDAKALLFEERVKPDGVSVLNVDDAKFQDLKDRTLSRVMTYGIKNPADYQAKNVRISQNGTEFDLEHNGKTWPVSSNLVGEFNVYNLLAAIAACAETGSSIDTLVRMSSGIPQVAGRMEQIRAGQPFNVVTDFAHTPDGMEKIFQYGREITPEGSKLIAVFGSAGKRDKAKRKVFGELADQYCDRVILTEDDPRDEDPKEIAEEIKSGMKKVLPTFIADRYEAIRQAIEAAQDHDTVLLLGKGDEPFIYREEGRAPWIGDDKAAIECIQRRYSEES